MLWLLKWSQGKLTSPGRQPKNTKRFESLVGNANLKINWSLRCGVALCSPMLHIMLCLKDFFERRPQISIACVTQVRHTSADVSIKTNSCSWAGWRRLQFGQAPKRRSSADIQLCSCGHAHGSGRPFLKIKSNLTGDHMASNWRAGDSPEDAAHRHCNLTSNAINCSWNFSLQYHVLHLAKFGHCQDRTCGTAPPLATHGSGHHDQYFRIARYLSRARCPAQLSNYPDVLPKRSSCRARCPRL